MLVCVNVTHFTVHILHHHRFEQAQQMVSHKKKKNKLLGAITILLLCNM